MPGTMCTSFAGSRTSSGSCLTVVAVPKFPSAYWKILSDWRSTSLNGSFISYMSQSDSYWIPQLDDAPASAMAVGI